MALTRRALLGGAGAGAAALLAYQRLPLAPAPAPSVAERLPGGGQPTGPRTDDDALHAARRLSYGATPSLHAEIAALGVDAWLDRQLDPASIEEDPQLLSMLDQLDTLDLSPTDLRELFLDQEQRRRIPQQLIAATVLRRIGSRRQLNELMVEFWSDHFSVFLGDGPVVFLKTIEDREVIRPRALGRFDDLLVADAQSPAMLVYLDNALSKGDDPNENYARELLELHTVGVTGGYDEDDIAAVARVLSGWSLDRATATFAFRPFLHADGPQEVMDWSTDGRGGQQDGEDLLRHLAHHPATATHLARKLARRFVSDHPSDELVASTAEVFLASDTAIAPTLRHLLTTDEFRESSGVKFRRPMELVTGAFRALGTTLPIEDLGRGRSQAFRQFVQRVEALGHLPFSWPAPNGFPDVAGAWLNTGALLSRWNAVQALVGAGRRPLGPVDVTDVFGDARSAGAAIDAAVSQLLMTELTSTERDAVLAYLGVGANDAFPADDRTARQTIALLLNSRHFQFR